MSSVIFEHVMFGGEFTAEFNGRGNQSAARNQKGGMKITQPLELIVLNFNLCIPHLLTFSRERIMK